MNLLEQIPVKDTLWEVPRTVIDKGSPAQDLWEYLDGIVGVGWVTAGKLMARKRPHLIPVFDRVVRDALMPNTGRWWVSLWQEFQDPKLRQQLAGLKAQAGVPNNVSLLRVLDVAVWMAGPGGPGSTPASRQRPSAPATGPRAGRGVGL